MTVDKKFKAKWLKALRSGKYEQGTGQLYEGAEGRYCCMGVACRVLGLKDDDGDFSLGKEIEGDFDGINYPTNAQLKMIGITRIAAKKLAHMNDDDRLSFEEIADYIDNRYK